MERIVCYLAAFVPGRAEFRERYISWSVSLGIISVVYFYYSLCSFVILIMATMEGSLSKWTNVMKGWQYRWFVLDDNAGILSYYTVSSAA